MKEQPANHVTIIQKLDEATRLIRDAANQLKEESCLELSFKITIKAQRSVAFMVSGTTDPGENLPPSK